MRKAHVLLVFAWAVLYAQVTNAVPIGLGDFSGSEFVETFTGQPNGVTANPLTLNGLTYTSNDSLAFQSAGFLFDNIPGASLSPTINTGGIGVFTIDFSTPVNRVGLLLSGGGDPASSWDLTVFGAGLVALETTSVTQPGTTDAVFGGLFRTENIVRLGVTKTAGEAGFFTFFDDVRIEAVPEPSILVLLGLGLVGLGYNRRRVA